MVSRESGSNPGDLQRFALDVLKRPIGIDQLSQFEQRIRWDADGTRGFGGTAELRSGIKLSTTKLNWDRPWAFQFLDVVTPLKFILCRGTGPLVLPEDGTSHLLGGGVLHVRRARLAVDTRFVFDQGGSEFELLALEIHPDRLRELLGVALLPPALEKLLGSSLPYEMSEQPMAPALSRLVEEGLYADARGPSRQLLLEAKGLEILASLTDELALASRATGPLGTRDIERLEQARHLLLQRMASPPSLPDLARAVGLNEFKLKAGFRTLFGNSVFGYLRSERMDRARWLLTKRGLSVTEVAFQVGYANPSKFASAFRRHFGCPPSALR